MNFPPFARLTLEEVRRSIRTPWLLIGWTLLAAAAWSSLVLGQREFDEQAALYADSVQARLEVQLRGTGHVLGRAPEPGLRVIRSPSREAVLVQGQHPLMPAAWEVTPAGLEALAPYANASPPDRAVWDLEILVRVLAGILGIGLGVASVVRDKSAGWVAALQSLPLSPLDAAAAKTAGGCVTIVMLVAAWWVFISIVLYVSPSPHPAPLWRVWILAIPAILYLCMFLGIGAFLGWVTRDGFRALVLTLVAWLLLALVGPIVSGLAGQLLDDSPPRSRMERERREQYADEMLAVERRIAQQMVPHLISVPAGRDASAFAAEEFRRLEPDWQAGVAEARKKTEAAEQNWRRRAENHARLVARTEWFSPGALVRQSMAELLDTGRTTISRWESAVADYQVALQRSVLDNRPVVNLRMPFPDGEQLMNFPRYTPPRFADLPLFETPDVSWLDRWRGVRVPLLALSIWLVLSLAAACAAGTKAIRTNS